jgi:nucleoside-diphosphate-sugar epimerase
VRADVRETSELQPLLAKADAVVHLAAIVGDPAARREPDLARSVNLEASRRLIEGCAEARIRHLVFVSTCSNYGVASPETLAAEDHPLNPLSLYAETKVGVERILLESSDLPFTCLRLATVYGVAPRMRFDLTVNQFTIEAHMARFLSIFNEDSWRPYVHVDDVARAIQTTLARPAQSLGRVFNVGNTDENYTKRMM